MSPGPARPDYEDVLREVEPVRRRTVQRIQVASLGKSVEGREIPCLTCTDPDVSAEDKQHVLIVAGQHGSEESGRAIVLELLNFLGSEDPEAAAILRNQVVAIVPSANPDGTMHNTRWNAAQLDVAHSYAFDAPATSVEGRALETFALRLRPELFVGIHGRAGGGMRERTWMTPAWGKWGIRVRWSQAAGSAD